MPIPFKYGFSFDLHALCWPAPSICSSVLEAVGDITATAMVSHRQIQGPGVSKTALRRRAGGRPVGDRLGARLPAAHHSAQNNGVIQMTGGGLALRAKFIAVIRGAARPLPGGGRFFTTIPSPVMGGAMVIMFSMIAIAGGRIIISHGFDRRETLIVATSLGLGLGVSMTRTCSCCRRGSTCWWRTPSAPAASPPSS